MCTFKNISNETISSPGDLQLFYSQIRSERGGRIELLVPGGMINAGLAVSGTLNKPATDLGIVSVRGGEIDAFVRNNFQVNQSRVFTLGGSDLMLYSALADIDAGRGAKTSSATPPPVLRITNGQVTYDYSGAVSGSGIAALTATGGSPGTVDLFAPYGEINAGEAGIRSAGNINLGAHVIVGGENITAGGVTSGVPSADTSGLSLSVGGLTDAASIGKSSDQMAQVTAQPGENQDSFLPTFISVEVTGLGNAEQDEKKDKEDKDKNKEKVKENGV
jgi:filamentous hemagglutinin